MGWGNHLKNLLVIVTVAGVFLPNYVSTTSVQDNTDAVWSWQCSEGKCEKTLITDSNRASALSINACKMLCHDYGNMWPKPTIDFQYEKKIAHVNHQKIEVSLIKPSGNAAALLNSATNRFLSHLKTIPPLDTDMVTGGKTLKVNIDVKDSNTIGLTMSTDEGYRIKIVATDVINANIEANNFFGARNALETLEQFIVFDDINSRLLIADDILVIDKPVYPHRGILLDTARNFFTIESIKRILDGMASCKLNTFHWHITDSQSFPFVSKSQPNLTKLGAFSPRKVYTSAQIIDLIQYALERGIKIIPEFDAPAHVGEGWQGTNLTVCFKQEPWEKYCYEPPCGQLNPTRPELYDILQGIYNDMFELFKPDVFHMGGDEVKNSCWNTSSEIQNWMLAKGWKLDDKGFLDLWTHFQTQAQEKVFNANGGKKLPLVLWTSTLTDFEYIDQYISNKDYIIQIWTTGKDKQIGGLLRKGYRLIISNYDALYLDCGFEAWVGEGNNWCSPYIGWQKVYDNSPAKIGEGHTNLILGAEAVLWSEQSDSVSMDNKIWPRAGALAERLWAEPKDTWRSAESRMLSFRERLINLGISPNQLQPEWCAQNAGLCYA